MTRLREKTGAAARLRFSCGEKVCLGSSMLKSAVPPKKMQKSAVMIRK